MADIGLLHRADCEASGVGTQHAAVFKGKATVYLCEHHTRHHAPALLDQGWEVFVLEKEAVPA